MTATSITAATTYPGRRRVTMGAIFLGARQLVTTFVGILAAALLSRWLTPADYGLYAQVSFWTMSATAMVIGDLGLVFALVRLPTEPSEEQWTAVSTVMFLLAGVTMTIAVGAGAWLAMYGRSDLLPLVLLLGGVTALRFLRTVPSARLQRQYRFTLIAGAEVAEALAFYVCALMAARAHAGVFALIAGVGAKEIVGLGSIWIASRTRSRFSMASLPALGGLVRVGLPQQGTGLLVGFTDAFQPIFIGGIFGAVTLGYVSWAYAVALMPLNLLTAASRVLTPVLAHVQDDLMRLRALTERASRLGMLIAAPIAGFILVRAEALITMIFHPKWLPAAELLQAFMPAIVLTAIANPVLQAYAATGKTIVPFRLAVGWVVLTWSLGSWMTWEWEVVGYGWFYVVLQLTYLPIFWFARRSLQIRLGRAVLVPFVASAIAAASLVWWVAPGSIGALLVQGCWFIFVYGVLVALLDRSAMIRDLQLVADLFRFRIPAAHSARP